MALCLCFCGGVVVARHWCPTPVLAMLGAALLVAGGIWQGSQTRLVSAMAFAVALGLGLLRGSALSASQSFPQPKSGVVVMEAVRASRPGPRCRVWARHVGGEAEEALDLAASMCPISEGQIIYLPASDYRARGRLPADDGQGGRWIEAAWIARSPSSAYWRAVAELRERGWEESRGDPARGLVVAATLGLRTALPPESRLSLRRAGLGHLLAVSGLHVGLVSLIFRFFALRLCLLLGHRPGLSVVLACIPIAAYVALTGAAAPAVRASLLIASVGVSDILGRPTHGPSNLVVVASAMVAWNPDWIADPGFQLSVVAMWAIVAAPPGLGSLAMSWRITWFIAPLCCLHFGGAPMHAVVANAVALPIFCGWTLPAGFLAWVTPRPLGLLPEWAAHQGAALLLDGAELLARMPALGPGMLGATALGVRWVVRIITRRVEGVSLAALLPPLAPVLCLLVMSLVPERWNSGTSRSGLEWAAMGTKRTMSVLSRSTGLASVGKFCLREPQGAGSQWSRHLRALGVTSVIQLRGSAGHSSEAPHLRQLRESLSRAGLYHEALNADCIAPDRAKIRRLLDRCLRRGPGDRAAVRGMSTEPFVECKLSSGWQALDLLPSTR